MQRVAGAGIVIRQQLNQCTFMFLMDLVLKYKQYFNQIYRDDENNKLYEVIDIYFYASNL